MGKKVIWLLCAGVILVGCTAFPPGNYRVMPIEGTLSYYDYTYCENGQCWNVQMVYPSPTQDTFPTEESPIPTPIPTVYIPSPTPITVQFICALNGTYNVRDQASLNGVVLGTASRSEILTIHRDWYQIKFGNSFGYVAKWVSKLCP